MGIELTTPSYIRVEAAQACSSEQATRTFEIEGIFNRSEDQIGEMTSCMRRIEEIADRLVGSAPTPPEAKPELAMPGWMGGLNQQNSTRGEILNRINHAINRIESVI